MVSDQSAACREEGRERKKCFINNFEVNGAVVGSLANAVRWKNAGENTGRISSSSVGETREGTRQIPHPSSNHDAADAADAPEIDVTRDVY